MDSTTKSCLDHLLNNNYISKDNYKFLKPCGNKLEIMYGLYKVYKFNPITRNVPILWPILSRTGNKIYNLANFLVPTLKEYTINELNACDSFSFCNEIWKKVLPLYMATFDIWSLFSNFPLDETIDVFLNRVFQLKLKSTEC